MRSGDGADEIGGGYPAWFGRYYAYAAEGKEVPEEFDSVNGGIKFIEYFDRLRLMADCDDLLIKADLSEVMENRLNYWNSLEGTPFDKMRKLHFKYRLVSMLERQNKVCMANSVENRVPFLDNKFVDFMFTLPEEVLMKKRKPMPENYAIAMRASTF